MQKTQYVNEDEEGRLRQQYISKEFFSQKQKQHKTKPKKKKQASKRTPTSYLYRCTKTEVENRWKRRH